MKKLVVIIFSFITLSCLTVSNSDTPEWISTYPYNEEYYVGIGTANTGDEAEDKILAEKRAINSIASHIMTKVESDSALYSREDSTGESFNYTEEFIETSVSQNISGLETVDTYYSDESGYWVYMRLSKKLWSEIQQQGIDDLKNRVDTLLSPVIEATDTSLIMQLENLYRAERVLNESPYKMYNSDQVDLVKKYQLLIEETISADIDINKTETSYGEILSGYVFVSSSMVNIFNNTPVELINSRDEIVLEGLTDDKGIFNFELDTIRLDSGLNSLKLFIRIDDETIYDPKISQSIEVKPLPVNLEVVIIPESVTIQGVAESAKTVLSNTGSPFSITDSSNLTLKLEISVQDFPPVDDFSLNMSHSSVVISLIRGNKTLYAFKSSEIKDGGITEEQARQRSVDKLLKTVLGDSSYIDEMKKVLFSD